MLLRRCIRLELDNNPPIIVTSPVSYKHARRSYYDPSFIRVLDFRGDNGNSSNFMVTGAVQGILTKTKEINGVSLYSMPCSLNKGIHKIQITGDLNIEIEFAVHTDSPTYVYTPHHIISCWSVIVVFLLIIVWHFVIIYGMIWTGDFVELLKLTHKWIRG
jgi:hypothetical protein